MPLAGIPVTITAKSDEDNSVSASKDILVRPVLGWTIKADGNAYKGYPNQNTNGLAMVTYVSEEQGQSLAISVGTWMWGKDHNQAYEQTNGFTNISLPAIEGAQWYWARYAQLKKMQSYLSSIPKNNLGIFDNEINIACADDRDGSMDSGYIMIMDYTRNGNNPAKPNNTASFRREAATYIVPQYYAPRYKCVLEF